MTKDELLLHIKYYPETGDCYRIGVRDCHGNYRECKPYLIKGVTRSDRYGYKRVSINGKRWCLHQLIYLLEFGFIPDTIDHIDGDCSNNKLSNLRATDRTGNMSNLKLRADNPTGHVGVAMKDGKFYAHAQKDGVRMFAGYFSNIEEAIVERVKMSKCLGFHENHGGVR